MSQITHHKLDPYPDPKDKTPIYINEPWVIDKSLLDYPVDYKVDERDNVRVYFPMDLSRDAILRRLNRVIAHYGEANEENESDFYEDVGMIISQIEIYDQIWFVRNMPEVGKHSAEAVSLVKDVISALEEIPDGCAECFPFETVEELRKYYDKTTFNTTVFIIPHYMDYSLL